MQVHPLKKALQFALSTTGVLLVLKRCATLAPILSSLELSHRMSASSAHQANTVPLIVLASRTAPRATSAQVTLMQLLLARPISARRVTTAQAAPLWRLIVSLAPTRTLLVKVSANHV